MLRRGVKSHQAVSRELKAFEGAIGAQSIPEGRPTVGPRCIGVQIQTCEAAVSVERGGKRGHAAFLDATPREF